MDPSSDPSQYDSSIDSLQSQIKGYQSNLNSSLTANSNTTMPTYGDESNQVKEQGLETQLAALQKKKLTAQWYGNDSTADDGASEEGANPGLIGTILNTLQKPLNTEVAGVKSLMGETPESGEDYSTLLKEHNVPYPLAAPLGFALDIAGDPINWLTGGEDTIVGRAIGGVARGASKGDAIGGLTAGLKSSALQKASAVAGALPGLAKVGDEGYEATRVGQLSQKANQAYETYKNVTGYDPLKDIHETGITLPAGAQYGSGNTRTNLQSVAKGIASFIPGGDKVYDALYYSSRDWFDNARQQDAVYRNTAKSIDEITGPGEKGAALSEAPVNPREGLKSALIKPNLSILKDVPEGMERDAIIDELTKSADDADLLNRNPQMATTMNPEQNAWRVIQDANNTDQMRQLLQGLKSEWDTTEGTGIKPYDDAVKWAKDLKVNVGGKQFQPLKDFLNAYNSVIQGVYKPAHTILSPVTWAMNVMSAPIMYMMMGGEDVPGLMKEYMKAYGALSGIDPRTYVYNSFFNNKSADWVKMATENPGLIKKVYGTGPGWFLMNGFGEQMRQAGKELGGNDDEVISQVQKFIEDTQAQLRKGNAEAPAPKGKGFLASLMGKREQGATTAGDITKTLREQAGREALKSEDLPIGFTVRDNTLDAPFLDNFENWVTTQAKAGNKPAQMFQNVMNTARAGYEHQDQAFRLAIAKKLTTEGLSERALKIMSRFTPFTPETDLLNSSVKNGQTMWRISPMKASDIAADMAINYSAMPAAIKMLRSVPLLGGPFASFSYAMGLRAAQTAAYNPAVFNKIAFGLQSASGTETPLERAAIHPTSGPSYYGFLDQPTMVRSPMNFFDTYPLYANLTNVLPYYTLNIFQPSSRTYSQTLPNDVVSAIDESPLLKDPLGSTLFNYLVLPSLLSASGDTADVPQSSMGSPLYPSDANIMTKTGYATRDLVDQFTPAAVAPAGAFVPEKYAQLLPGYRTREFAEGKDQRNALGIPGNESASSRQIRNLLGYMGFPVERLDTTAAASAISGSGS